eukprot:TRINITY_DN3546_c0_g1_i1.p1 TRINITY_DN3546_c0_g1~~TRINITY_DN3546_c0_g1_i1.p1  ORF type:complete len:129 (-),score=27.31 TRINITY_DN3546_c0_g1_i1:65-427(-)
MSGRRGELAPQVNRVLYVKHLPFKITTKEIYDIFGRYGAIRQIRLGNVKETRGTAFVVYEDIYNAKTAVEKLNGFNVNDRYLVVLYYQKDKAIKRGKEIAAAEALKASNKESQSQSKNNS